MLIVRFGSKTMLAEFGSVALVRSVRLRFVFRFMYPLALQFTFTCLWSQFATQVTQTGYLSNVIMLYHTHTTWLSSLDPNAAVLRYVTRCLTDAAWNYRADWDAAAVSHSSVAFPAADASNSSSVRTCVEITPELEMYACSLKAL